MLLNARRFPPESNDPELLLLAIEDITDRRQAEAAVKHSEVRYRRLFEKAKDGILILDADTGKVIDANPFMTALLGYSHDEFLGKELWEIGLFRDIKASQTVYRELREKGYVRYENLPLESRSGHKVEVEFVSNVYAENDHQVVQCNIRDITERRQMQVRLREAEQRLRFVMDSMPQKIFTAKPNGDVDYFNPIWTHYTGLSFEQIRDWGWTQFIHPDDVAENVRVWKRSIDFVEPFQFEHRFRRADGEYRWHISRAVSLRDAEGKVVMWVGSDTDIHEQRQMADELQKHAAELSEADRRKSEFLAMLAHELRNPLAPIRNGVQILRLGGDDRAVRAVSEMMDRQVGQMVRLVDDLLDVSRISRGKIELRMERVELASVVHHAVEAARSLYKSMNHDLTVSLPSQPIYLNGDPARLTQVVGNLLNNACKFTDKGGRIRLTVEREGEQTVIRVQDNGIGIATDQLPRIFDMFTQVDSSLERSTSGLGIGLSLVENLVEMHGGTVEVHSAGLGQGSEFVVCLPVLIETPKRPPDLTVSEPTPTARRILVVDDNRDSAKSLAMLLKLTGHETHTAYDGLEAVAAAAALRPEVVLLDIGLPKLNGYEAARQLRQQPWGKGMVLVALTGLGQEEDRQRSEEVGFDAHMVKPIDIDGLQSLLARPELYGRSEAAVG
jgi:PAS domain S-box-containing protein